MRRDARGSGFVRAPGAAPWLALVLLLPAFAGCLTPEDAPAGTSESPGLDIDAIEDIARGGGGGGTTGDAENGGEIARRAPAISGFDLALSAGTYWDFSGTETSESFAQGSRPTTRRTTYLFRVSLGEPERVGAVTAFPVRVTGDAYGVSFTHLAIDDHVLLGSRNGRTFETLFDAMEGSWMGGGFLAGFASDTPVTPTRGSVGGSTTYTIFVGGGEGGCSYSREAGQTICAGDSSWQQTRRETFRPGIGPVGLDRTFSYQSSGGGFHSASSSQTTIRLVDTSLRSPEGWRPEPTSWMPRTSMPTPRSAAQAVSLPDGIYVLGGQQVSREGDELVHSRVRTMERYDPTQDAWEARAPLPNVYFGEDANYGIAAAAHAGILYVFPIGLTQADTVATTVHAYDPSTDTWSPRTGHATGLLLTRATTVGDDIYVFGVDFTERHTRAYVYSPLEDAWRPGPTAPRFVAHFSLASAEDYLFVVGGLGLDDSAFDGAVDVFTPASGRWVRLPDMTDARAAPAVFMTHGRLHVAGGVYAGDAVRSAETYTETAVSWSRESFPMPRAAAAAASFDGKGYLFGGRVSMKNDYDGSLSELNLDLVHVYTPEVA